MMRFDVVGWAMFGMVETVGIRQVMWFVMLESSNDRVIGVDTLGQQVLPRVQYGTACLRIRDAMGSVPCLDEWEFGVVGHENQVPYQGEAQGNAPTPKAGGCALEPRPQMAMTHFPSPKWGGI
jgi:hypothetical protein